MDTQFKLNTSYDLHLSDIYYEKKPTKLTYTRHYGDNGNVIFKPLHSYILPIWEYSTQNTSSDIKTDIVVNKKFSLSGIFLCKKNDTEIDFTIEYLNTGDVWTIDLNTTAAQIKFS